MIWTEYGPGTGGTQSILPFALLIDMPAGGVPPSANVRGVFAAAMEYPIGRPTSTLMDNGLIIEGAV